MRKKETKTKITFLALVVGVVVLFGGVAMNQKANATNPNSAVILPEVDLHNKLEIQFGEEAQNLKLVEKYSRNSKSISLFKGNGGFFEIDDEGNIIAYIKSKVVFDNKRRVPIDQAQDIAIDKFKSVRSDIDMSEFKLARSVLANDFPEVTDDQKFYSFIWEKRNKNGVAIGTIAVNVNLSGNIKSIKLVEKNEAIASSEINITEEAAKEITLEKLVKSGVARSTIKIEYTEKVVENRLLWRIDYSYPREIGDYHDATFIDAITGDIIDPVTGDIMLP